MMKSENKKTDRRKSKRLESIDSLRGLTMVSMILYHFCWDLKYLNGLDIPWYGSLGSYIWQQSICWTFIIISGFCLNLAGNPIKNGALVFVCGIIVSCVTLIAVPDAVVMYGVLTLLGSCMIIIGAVHIILKKLVKGKTDFADPIFGFLAGAVLFAVTKPINRGYLNFGVAKTELPEWLYKGQVMTYLGFMEKGFYSSDYFSLMPWIFLFLAGYFLFLVCRNNGLFKNKVFHISLPFFSMFGKYSLIVYMLHQPVLYVISMIIG